MRDLIGSILGNYRIVEKIGEGGMGEVYRARDERLGRDVAIKVLPEHFADDAAWRERFEREARTVSSLNHPTICTLHDIGRQDGIDFIVMEYLEGETLAHRLAKGALPLDRALRVGIQIAEGLDTAHRRGVVHRDLKPGNIMLTSDGAKLLDFGLAKLVAPDSGVAESALATEDMPLTAQGALIGTVPYMAPEQLEGREADSRTDVFAFGAVLFETITGTRAFEGASRASLISEIMSSEPPPVSEIQSEASPALDRTVEKCLAKDPENRWQTVRDLVDELQWILSGPAAEAAVGAKFHSRRLAYGALIGALVTAAILWVSWPENTPTPSTVRLQLDLPDGQEIGPAWTPPFVFSPDGSQLVYLSQQTGGGRQLYLRPINDFEALPLDGTEGAQMPFFSPDGRWIGYFVGGKLWKLSLAGGAPVAICEVPQLLSGASWGPDDSIVFAVVGSGLMEVSAAGGSPTPLTTQIAGEGHWWPQVLPDGKAVVFTVDTKSGFRSAVASLENGENHVLEEVGEARAARYVPTGHLVYAQGGKLLAVPFDPTRLEVSGVPNTVLDGVHTSPTTGLPYFAVSSTGALVYLPGGQAEAERQLVSVDRQGVGTPIVDERGNFMSPHYSPDGTQVAVSRWLVSRRREIWVFDLTNGARIRVTTGGDTGMPVWGPEDDRVTYWRDYETITSKVVGGDVEEELYRSHNPVFPGCWTPAGDALLFFEIHPETRGDIWVLSGAGEARPWIATEFAEGFPRVSPDGRWLAYVSNESGRYEVYVQAYPEAGEKLTVSTEGGVEPLWSPDGRELFYRNFSKMMVVAVQTDPVFRSSRPRELFDRPYVSAATLRTIATTYDVAPDGRHFLMMEGGEEGGGNRLNVVLNWFGDLKRLAPGE